MTAEIDDCCPTCGALPRDQHLGRLSGQYELIIDQSVEEVAAHVHQDDGRVRLTLTFAKGDEIALDTFRIELDPRAAKQIFDRLGRAAEVFASEQ